MKNRVFWIFIAFSFLSCFFGCTKNKADNSASSQKKLSIVCTMFPQYDWCRAIIGDGEETDVFDLVLLMDKGADLHNYQPTVSDLVKLQNAAILICVGGESDGWISDALKSAKKEIRVLRLVEELGNKAKIENKVDVYGAVGGVLYADEYETANGGAANLGGNALDGKQSNNGKYSNIEDIEYDEHVWLSVRNAMFFVEKISDAICERAANEDIAYKYRRNSSDYIEELRKLDSDFSSKIGSVTATKFDGQSETGISRGADISAAGGTILVADRFPFRYLVDDYNINYFAAFPGCSAESEASFQTIVFLADKVREWNLPVVYVLENSDEKIAKSVIQNSGTDAKIVRLNSLQSVTEKDIKAGATYISLMEENLSALKANFKNLE